MSVFFCGLIALVLGYFTYGKWIERVLRPDARRTPAWTRQDGVDYVPMPLWKNALIQLLNIAGVGPVIGVIIGIKFGSVCFWIIPLGCIFGGAVHDFISGFMSLRSRGSNLPALTQRAFGRWYAQFYLFFVCVLLLLVVAVFVNVPTGLVKGIVPSFGLADATLFWIIAAIIFLYYVVATLFPVDRIIGRIYPFFGAILLIGTLAMLVMLSYSVICNPTLLTETEAFKAGMFADQPIIPCLFVTIACGIISGFHATQSPIVARTLQNERQARTTYYGMMIVEGLIAMVWAAAGMAIYNLHPELMHAPAVKALIASTRHFLGSWLGVITVVSVVVLAITSGDTALRSLRLTIAEGLQMPQRTLASRFLLLLPMLVIVAALIGWSNQSAETFEQLWKYFAWGNQILSASTLMVCTVWMMRHGHSPWYTLIPGAFMTFIVTSFILWSSPVHEGCPYGLNIPINIAYAIAGAFTFFCCVHVLRLGRSLSARRWRSYYHRKERL